MSGVQLCCCVAVKSSLHLVYGANDHFVSHFCLLSSFSSASLWIVDCGLAFRPLSLTSMPHLCLISTLRDAHLCT